MTHKNNKIESDAPEQFPDLDRVGEAELHV
jgi:hypothetical protein